MNLQEALYGHHAKRAEAPPGTLSHVLHVPHPRDSEKSSLDRRSMNVQKSWLDAPNKTIEEQPQLPHRDSGEPTAATVQNVQKPREAEREVGGEVVDLSAACVLWAVLLLARDRRPP